jgi:tetratricopeptide (TPR) repeat protein
MAEGMRHFAEGRYFDAAGAFYRVLQIDPNHVDARRMGYVACEFITLGEVRSSLLARTTSEAARAAARAAALDAVARAVAGTLPVADARQPLADALALSPDEPELRAAEVTLAERQSSVARAVSAGRAAAASRDLDERLAAAQADLARGKLSKAVRGFEEVMAADPGKVSPQYHTALEGVREAKDKMKADSKAAWTEANSALKSGNYVSARKLLKEVVAIDPYNEAAVARLAETRATLKEQASDFYKEARTLEGLGQNEKAIALYHKVQLYVDDAADPLSQKAQARTEALLR